MEIYYAQTKKGKYYYFKRYDELKNPFWLTIDLKSNISSVGCYDSIFYKVDKIELYEFFFIHNTFKELFNKKVEKKIDFIWLKNEYKKLEKELGELYENIS